MSGRSSHNVLQHLHPHNHQHLHHQRQEPAFSGVLGSGTLADIASLVRRSESSSTCAPDNNSAICQKPADSGNTGTLTIAIAAAIPTCAAIVVLFFLHRRIRRRQRAEDANDPHASLDFGMGNVKTSKKGKPEMTSTDMGGSLRPGFRGRGLSMDLGSSYLLPAAIQGSHDSLHSMSRVMTDHDDPYRPVTFVKSDTDSSRPTSRMRPDNASVHTGFSERSGEKSRLIQTTTHESRPHALPQPPSASSLGSTLSNPPRGASLATGAKSPGRWYPRDDKKYGSESPPDLSAAPATPQDLLSDRSMPSFPQAVQIPRGQYMEDRNGQQQSLLDMSDARNPAHDALHITVPSPAHNRQSPPRSPAAHQPYMNDFEVPANEEPQPRSERLATHADLDTESRRVSVMGLRPLPPDDVIDNPEQRANRIRSFYKEYFDDSKPNPAGQYPQYDPYGEEYYADYLEDGAVYDPETGAFFTQQRPYAEPIGRRAMTPPPRGAAPMVPSHRSVVSTQSAGRPLPPPKKRLPPPKALQSLPTPHMLRDDTSMHSPIDFAPPTSFRDRQLGRGPDSPTGTARPYSPAFRAHVPLAQSFDDLAAMPSPFALRKSGTFTGLDFAPPPRFRGTENGSDSGSIRSNRSGISAVQRDAIRAGAYRVSRLPKEMVGTTMDLATTLKPSWDMRK